MYINVVSLHVHITIEHTRAMFLRYCTMPCWQIISAGFSISSCLRVQLLQLENHDEEMLYMINTSKDMRSERVAMWHSGILCVCAYPRVVLGNTFMHHTLVSASFAALNGISNSGPTDDC